MMIPTELVTYENTANNSSSTLSHTNPFGDSFTRVSFGGRNKLLRQGKRRPKPRFLDATPYKLERHDVQAIRGTWTHQEPGFKPSMYAGSNSGDPSSDNTYAPTRFLSGSPVHDSELRDLATVRALAKLNQKDLDLGAAWAERGKTASLLAGLADLSVDCLKALYKRDLKGFLNRLNGDAHYSMQGGHAVVDTYMTYHYGIKPALQDIAGAVKSLTRSDPDRWRITTRGGAAYDRSKDGSAVVGSSCAVSYVANLRQSCRTHIQATRREISWGDDMRWSLGLDDPLSSAWEVTPFSSFVDWAVPIGDWLQAVNGSKYFHEWQVSTSQYTRETVVYSPGAVTRGVGWDQHIYKGSARGSYDLLAVTRTVSNTIPIVGVPIKDPRSLDHMAKGLSLLALTLARGGEPPRYLRY